MPPYERQAEPSKGNFLSWDAGESKDLVILSEKGTESRVHWIGQKSYECTGEGCSSCATGSRPTLRWSVDTKCEGEEISWEMSNTTFFGVEDVASMVGHLKDLRLRVTRYGSGLKTRYSVLPITGEEKAAKASDEIELLAAKIRGLCKLAGMNPRKELTLFRSEIASDDDLASDEALMRAFYEYINAETLDLQHVDEPPPDEPQDIGRYF